MRFERSMTNVAYDVLKANKEMKLNELWKSVCEELKIQGDDLTDLLSTFYTQLTLDGRFFLKDGLWVLRQNVRYEEYSKAQTKYNAVGITDDTSEEEYDLDFDGEESSEDDEDSNDEDEDEDEGISRDGFGYSDEESQDY